MLEAGGQIVAGVADLGGELAQGTAQVLFADGLAGGGTQGLGVADLPGGGVAAELGAEILGCGENQRLEGAGGGGAGFGGVLAGGQQDPQGLAGLAGARPGVAGGGQGLAGGANGVQFVGLAATAAGPPGPVSLDDQVPGAGERAGQARAVRAAALDCPGRAEARGVLGGEARQAGVAGGVCADLDGGQVRAEPVNGYGGMSVGVGIDADDDVSQFCEHGHGPFSRGPERFGRSGTGLGTSTRRHICDESRARGNGHGQASDQASKVSQAGAGDPGRHV